MTNAEMNRRIATMTPTKVEHVYRMVRQTTYTAREVADLTRVKLANVNALVQRYENEMGAL